MAHSPMKTARAWLVGCGLTAAAVPQAAAAALSDRESEARCRQNAMPACTALNETVSFSLQTGQQAARVGTTDPIWTIDGVPARTVDHATWSPNGPASWVSGAVSGHLDQPAGEFVYVANIWFSQDPYLYGLVRTNLTIGADNTLVSVSINGTEIFTGDGGDRDFEAFESFSHDEHANWPWIRGCNEIRVTTHNSSGPAGVSILGEVLARCSQCLTERPPPPD